MRGAVPAAILSTSTCASPAPFPAWSVVYVPWSALYVPWSVVYVPRGAVYVPWSVACETRPGRARARTDKRALAIAHAQNMRTRARARAQVQRLLFRSNVPDRAKHYGTIFLNQARSLRVVALRVVALRVASLRVVALRVVSPSRLSPSRRLRVVALRVVGPTARFSESAVSAVNRRSEPAARNGAANPPPAIVIPFPATANRPSPFVGTVRGLWRTGRPKQRASRQLQRTKHPQRRAGVNPPSATASHKSARVRIYQCAIYPHQRVDHPQ